MVLSRYPQWHLQILCRESKPGSMWCIVQLLLLALCFNKYSRKTPVLVSIQWDKPRAETSWIVLKTRMVKHPYEWTNQHKHIYMVCSHPWHPPYSWFSRCNTLSTYNACRNCQNQNSFLYRFTECSDGPLKWTWTKQKLRRIFRIDYKRIHKEWTLYPDIRIWPPQRQTPVLWIIGQFVYYRIKNGSQSSLRDYIDFIGRAKWKLHQTTTCTNIGTYLAVLEYLTLPTE